MASRSLKESPQGAGGRLQRSALLAGGQVHVVPIKDGLPLGMKPPVMAKAFTWKKDVDELFFTEVTLLRCATAKEGLYAFKPASHSPQEITPLWFQFPLAPKHRHVLRRRKGTNQLLHSHRVDGTDPRRSTGTCTPGPSPPGVQFLSRFLICPPLPFLLRAPCYLGQVELRDRSRRERPCRPSWMVHRRPQCTCKCSRA